MALGVESRAGYLILSVRKQLNLLITKLCVQMLKGKHKQ